VGQAPLAADLAQVRKQLADERANILAQEKTTYDVEMAHRARLEAAIADQTFRADRLAQDSIEFNLLKRKVDADRKLHEGLLNRLKEMDVSVGLKALNVHVIDRGYVPTLPVSPNVPLNLALALTLGLVFGAGVACSVEFFDQTVKTPEDVEQRLGMPFLGAIPAFSREWKEGGQGHLVVVNDGERLNQPRLGEDAAVYWESYRSLRTSILFSSPQDRPQTILVTSGLPGEGKSTTAINLAISLAQTGAQTLLVEVDMRKPKIADVFNITSRSGLSAYLAGVTELSAELHPTAVPNLSVVPSGPTPPNPPELLGSGRMTRGLALMRRHFQFIVFDGPPLLPVSDAAIVATQVDGVVLVVDGTRNATHATKARNLLRSVSAKILGALVNKAQVERMDYYRYSDYVNSDVVPRSEMGL
jgi:capsular exopolysaccharide synthesis family protein